MKILRYSPTMIDVSIVDETSPEANWNRQTGRQADRRTDKPRYWEACASKNLGHPHTYTRLYIELLLQLKPFSVPAVTRGVVIGLSTKPLFEQTGTDRRGLLFVFYNNHLQEVVVIGGQDYVHSQADALTKKCGSN